MSEHKGRLRIGLIFGGRSGEHKVSLMSARTVLNALDKEMYEVHQIGITQSGTWLSGKNALDMMSAGDFSEDVHGLTAVTILPDPTQPGLYAIQSDHQMALEKLADLDVVIPMLHGTFGEDGTLQGLLELADLAYAGAGVVGSAVGMDKGIFKDIMIANGIPVVESIVVLRSELEKDPESILVRAEELAPYPLFTKPANLGSSVGITKCHSRADLVEGLMEAAQFDRRLVIERGINAREIEVSVLGNDNPEASVPGEVLPSREFYSYESKYIDGTSGLLIPAPLSDEMTTHIRELAVRAYKSIDCAGMARVDFLVDKDEPDHTQGAGVYINEVNTIPGFTGISMYPKLWEASGLPYPGLIERLIELALSRKADRDRTVHRKRRPD